MKKKGSIPSCTKESKSERKARVSSGVSFRPSVIPPKKGGAYNRKQKHKKEENFHD